MTEQSSLWPVAITTISASITALIVTWITARLAISRERESDWRKIRFGEYHRLTLALAGIVEGRGDVEAHVRYADAFASVLLVAPLNVARALQDFQDENSISNLNRSYSKVEQLKKNLMSSMRSDIQNTKSKNDEGINFMMIRPLPVDQIK